ncbi:hypothetical protein [Rhodococcoides fascians]|uniref:hypothetical protein n=1 Tax=Rhodococcoides fascians TaxID=1828 RepID=UPI00277D6837|nr:hypothetical protein [Rhodococcus fascians]MDQ0281741.1 DNA-binding transcriptional regulator GbsR (MarR family) [Rhodococcus fascians]
MTTVETITMTTVEARELTDEIRADVEHLWSKIERAYSERAWRALGYPSWDAYTAAEFDTVHLRLPKAERAGVVGSMRDAGMTVREIASATGMSVGTVSQAVTPPAFKNEHDDMNARRRDAEARRDRVFALQEQSRRWNEMFDRAAAIDPELPEFIMDELQKRQQTGKFTSTAPATIKDLRRVIRLQWHADAEILRWHIAELTDQLNDAAAGDISTLARQIAHLAGKLESHLAE